MIPALAPAPGLAMAPDTADIVLPPANQVSKIPPHAPLLNTAAMIRGVDELAISESAMNSARANAAAANSMRQQLIAQQVEEVAKEPYQKVTGLVSEAKADELKVRKYALLASQYRDHAEKVADEFHRLKKEAANVARDAAAGWIAQDAGKVAERTAVTNKTAFAEKKGDKIAEAVAAAAEPYHLALLRNQKFCEEAYTKAKGAQSGSLKLQADARQLSLKAQELQATGLGPEALGSITQAKGMMIRADDLRQWADKLYKQANTACATAGGYVGEEQMAANSAAAMTVVNEPMKLPDRA